MQFIDYVIQSGRAVLYPVYKGTYERADGTKGSGPPLVKVSIQDMITEIRANFDISLRLLLSFS